MCREPLFGSWLLRSDGASRLARPKEPVLPRRPRHRAPGTAERGVLGFGRPRHRPGPRGRAGASVALWAICGFLLVAAPVALIFSSLGGGSAGAESEGTPGTSQDGGSSVGGGAVGGGHAATLTTEAS